MKAAESAAIMALVIVGILLGVGTVGVSAGSIDPGSEGRKYAYAGNIGWSNFAPAGGSGVTVTGTTVTGYAWAENVGWINLGPAQHGGINHDGAGELSGYAWGENVGWISFSCENTASCDTVDYGVTIDPDTGAFMGNAWGENVGWIGFGSQSQLDYMVVTSWRGQITVSGRVSVAIAGHANLGVANAGVSLEGTGHVGETDGNGDFIITDVPPGNYILVVTAPDLVPLTKAISVTQGQQLDAGLPQMTVLQCHWDIKGDGRIGLEEAIHALQVTAGVRDD